MLEHVQTGKTNLPNLVYWFKHSPEEFFPGCPHLFGPQLFGPGAGIKGGKSPEEVLLTRDSKK